MLKQFFKKTPALPAGKGIGRGKRPAPEVPGGMWKKCNHCGKPVFTEDVIRGFYICPECGKYFRMPSDCRIAMIADEGSFEPWDEDVSGGNPIQFPGYEKKLEELKEKTGLSEAVVTGKARIGGIEAVLGVCDSRFLMASMGHAAGEKITRAIERAKEEKLPVILFCCSGGARMQEGIISLMQMAKTAAACRRHSEAGLLYLSVLTDPTTGGVTASFAMLGDLILAEPGALIGFAGTRVIEQTIRQKLPENFQKAEFLMEHGFVDRIINRETMKEELIQILTLHRQKERNVREAVREAAWGEQTLPALHRRTAWERVELARKPGRLTALDYIEMLFDGFLELHGDRNYGDDRAVTGGLAFFRGRPVTVIAQQKGKTTKENVERNFAMPSPEGYRKALRLMKQAEKFGRPVICFVDTPGAFCGMEAEERGQGEAIARNLFEMAGLKTPVLSIVIGEGGSGGALALAVSDEVWMMENAIYSVLSPEGFASVLWKDSSRAREAAAVMKLTARDLYKRGVIERIIPEPEPAGEEEPWKTAERLGRELELFLERMEGGSREELVRIRYDRFRKF